MSPDQPGSPLQYQFFDARSAGFMRPRVPLLPSLGRGMLGTGRAGRFELLGAGQARRVYRRGRYALFEALRSSGVTAETAYLTPALHCRTMLDPAIRLGATVLFYGLTRQLAPDLRALRAQMANAAKPVRAVLLTHYFGMAQPADAIQAVCDEFGATLIEDCSHAFFNPRRGLRLGSQGRYAIASPYKFLPSDEGGLLLAKDQTTPLPAQTRWSGPTHELRTLAHVVSQSLGRFGNRLPSTSDNAALADAPVGRYFEAHDAGVSALYTPADEGKAASITSRWIARACDIDAVADARRHNYRRWFDTVRGTPRCRPLFEAWPDESVPYMFPLVLDHPEIDFARLKRGGLPIWRWDEMALSDCPISRAYSRSLLHLPCHQSLTDRQLAWMTDLVRSVLRAHPR